MFEILLQATVCTRPLQMIPDQEVPSLGNPAPVQPCLFSRGKHLRRRGGRGISPWTELFVFLSRSLQGGLLPKRRSSVQAGEKAGFSFKEARRPLGLCDDNSGGGSPSLARAVTNPLHSVPDPRWRDCDAPPVRFYGEAWMDELLYCHTPDDDGRFGPRLRGNQIRQILRAQLSATVINKR